MTRRWDLSAQQWTLRGWRMNDWELGASFARLEEGRPDVPPIIAAVPGSVRGALRRAGIASDPEVGLQSRETEWIEHRHWSFTTLIPDAAAEPGARLVLVAESLDYQGVVLVGSEEVGRFEGAFTSHRFDVTDAVARGGRRLTIVFTRLPSDLGQIGRTSRVREFKARFNYGWDWTPRIVQIGIAGPVVLEREDGHRLEDVRLEAGYNPHDGTGEIRVRCEWAGPGTARLAVRDPSGAVSRHALQRGETRVALGGVQSWRLGDGRLYEATVELCDADGAPRDSTTRRLGFRDISWRPVEGAPDGAEPWLLHVNGEAVFVAGVNWVPIRPDYADVGEDDYRIRLQEYRRLGVNTLRVWGGAGREKDVFYDLADELGLAVWQELPLSSSGLDNLPPSDDPFVAQFAQIAEEYVRRLAHHPCIVLWGGGNELATDPDDGSPGVPLTSAHPALRAAERVIRRHDPRRRFVATSPSGPSFLADPARRGAGVHHDVHGPWETEHGHDEWAAYWDADDALFRSEVGVGGASPMELLRRCGLVLPTSTLAERERLIQLWSHSSAWWLGPLRSWDGSVTLDEWVHRSQQRQAELLSYAALRTRSRFPRVGGFLVWLGHDTFPCAVSLAILDAEGRPKPAAEALGRVFRGELDR